MDIEQKLVDYLKAKYSPLAILIHGSRASGFAREHSDWDFAILVDKDTQVDREIIDGANIEVRVIYSVAKSMYNFRYENHRYGRRKR